MENKTCSTCQFCKRLPFSTLFECKKYDKVLEKNPPLCCKQCLDEQDNEPKEDDKSNKQKPKKKDVIEVK